MSEYFVVMDVAAERAFVAGFADPRLAEAFARGQRDLGRLLIVINGKTGDQVFPSEASTDISERPSELRCKPTE